MKNFLDNVFGAGRSDSPSKETSEHNLRVATAALLLEIAGVDEEFTEEERSVIIKALKDHFEVTTDEVDEILRATKRELDQQIDLYYFTNQINEHFDKDQKIEIIELVWRVIYTDDHLNGHEDFLVHRFAKLLRLHHSELIDAKLRIKGE
jgi:uncharacterized tellurite resistance protein B-like protein